MDLQVGLKFSPNISIDSYQDVSESLFSPDRESGIKIQPIFEAKLARAV